MTTAARWLCGACGSPWAPGAPCCPRCRSLDHTEDVEAEDGMLKIDRDGRVSDSAAIALDTAALEEKQADAKIAELEAVEAQEHPGTGEPMEGVEHPADGTMSPLAGSDPAPGEPEPVQVTQLPEGEFAVPEPAHVPPRVPPRRTPPGAAGG